MSNGPTFLDSAHAPDVFADSATGFFVSDGNMKITFEAYRVDHSTSPGPINRVVIGRLVMPLASAEALARGMLDMIEKSRQTPQQQSSATIQ